MVPDKTMKANAEMNENSRIRIPILTLALTCLVAFGLMLPSLGFYWDDWTIIYLTKARGLAGLQEQFSYDRPLSLWLYAVTDLLAGTSPLRRQILAFLARLMTVFCFWLAMRRVFRGKPEPVFWMALLFAVYPLFFQQSIATTYTHPFILYALFSLSLWFMLKGMQQPRYFVVYQGLGLAAFAANVISAEYFLGLELIRPLILWYTLDESEERPPQRILHVLRVWSPYLVILCGFVVYRLFFLRLPENTNPPVLLYDFVDRPWQTTVVFLQGLVRDFITCIFTAWQSTIAPAEIDLFDRSSALIWLAGLALCAALALLMRRYGKPAETPEEAGSELTWTGRGLVIGGVAIALGMLPFWVGGKHLGSGFYADRVALPAMFGAAIFVVSLAYIFFRPGWQRLLILSVMAGLAAAAQLRAADGYRLDWEKQVRFAWQLHWRAPAIQAHTLVVSDDSLFKYTNTYSLSAMLSTLYPSETETNRLPLWFLEANDAYETRGKNVAAYQEGVVVEREMRSLSFSGLSSDSLVIDYHPSDHCLWVLRQEDAENLDLPEISRTLASSSNLSRIRRGPSSQSPPAEIFGAEPAPDWCTYYEQAELARQSGDWGKITSLWEDSAKKDFSPRHPYERLVFAEGYARRGQWQKAYDLSRDAYRRQINLQAPLCSLWQRLIDETQASDERDMLDEDLRDRLKCP